MEIVFKSLTKLDFAQKGSGPSVFNSADGPVVPDTGLATAIIRHHLVDVFTLK